MCRSNANGGRRCPACSSPEAREGHNERRRANRAIRSAIASWAGSLGEPEAVQDGLRLGPPSQAKQWAQQHGVPASLLAAATDGDPRLRDLTYWWTSAALLEQISVASRPRPGSAVESSLLTADVVSVTYPEIGGVNLSRAVELADGTRGIFKPFAGLDQGTAGYFGHDSAESPLHEVGAFRLAESMGPPWSAMVPPTVLRSIDGLLGSFQARRPGLPGHRLKYGDDSYQDENMVVAAVFDYVSGQQDRHPYNYLFDDGDITLIDHGFGFAVPGDMCSVSHFQRACAGQVIGSAAMDVLRRVFDSDDTGGLAGIITADRVKAVRDRLAELLVTRRIPAVIDDY